MARTFAVGAALLLMTACNSSAPTEPSGASKPSFLNNTTGCTTATAATAGTAGQSHVITACTKGQRP
jgi:hypothetical protein